MLKGLLKMAKGKKRFYGTLYQILFALVLLGALAGTYYLPNITGLGGSGKLDDEKVPPQEAITLREGVEVTIRHAGKVCELGIEDLPPGFSSFNLTGADRQDILSLLNQDWELIVFEPEQLVLQYNRELCPICRDLHFIGLYGNNIAIFNGIPPDGVLVEITKYEFKEIYREDLERGVPFTTEEEKKSVLESYTT
jgi:hypothetical protein